MSMNTTHIKVLLVFAFGLLSILTSCQKDQKEPLIEKTYDVLTYDATEIKSSSAVLHADFWYYGKGERFFLLSDIEKDIKGLVKKGARYDACHVQQTWYYDQTFYLYYACIYDLRPSTEYYYVACVYDGGIYYCSLDVLSFTTLP